ncbi:NINE protein [Paracoccus sp. MBLB3053]|uniref:NINE protein n=1 Tax=Paracoccus aurantius TaxID=3073814 RepID=A0ABU2HP74_9RHOB|nr:NINE protein [Paracoccus sp. MBLB3053]MDS9466547.1 NINE protein [Paracoccus sp. MBLB3053]
MTLDTQQQILIEQRLANDGKNMLLAYFLLLAFGSAGIHRFYLGKTKSAKIMLGMFILGIVTMPLFFAGLVLIIPLMIWSFIDLFRVPGMVNERREELRRSLTAAVA